MFQQDFNRRLARITLEQQIIPNFFPVFSPVYYVAIFNQVLGGCLTNE